MPAQAALDALNDPDPQKRIRAIRQVLQTATAEDWEVWQRLEWLALYDRDPRVRQVALSALLTPEGQKYYQLWLPTLTISTFHSRAQELERLKDEGMVDVAAAEVILDFYRQHAPEPLQPQKAQETSQEPRPAVPPTPPAKTPPAQVWMSILVYIGAFLVAAASLLLARVPGWRLPVLWGGTALFFLVAAGLWFLFRPGASVFYGLATFFLWADVYVLLQEGIVSFSHQAFHLAMALTTLGIAGLWAIGTLLFRSPWFALLSAVAMPVGAVWLSFALFATPETRLFWGAAFSQAMLTALWFWVWVLRRRDPSLARPPRLFIGLLSSLHALLAVFWLPLVRFLAPWPVQEIRFPLLVSWGLVTLFFLTALLAWPLPTWDAPALTWSLFGFGIAVVFLQEQVEASMAPLLAGLGLAYALMGIGMALLPRFQEKRNLAWPWWLAAWLLMALAFLGMRPEQWGRMAGMFLAGTMLYALAAYQQRSQRLVAGAVSLFIFAYATAAPLWYRWMSLPRREATLWQDVLLVGLLTILALGFPRYWSWAVVLPGLLPAFWLAQEAYHLSHSVSGISALLLLAGFLALWSLATQWPFWLTLGLGVVLWAHYMALPPLWQPYWPATYLPYPFLFLALEQGLVTYFPEHTEVPRKGLRFALWVYTGLLALLALSVDNMSGPLFSGIGGTIYLVLILLYRTPWPAVASGSTLLLALARGLYLQQAPERLRWMAAAVGVVAVFLFLIFRKYRRHHWASVWAVIGQLFMYGLGYFQWMNTQGRFIDFVWMFGETLAGLLMAALFRSGAWLWPSLLALFLAVATVIIGALGGAGVLLVVGCSGLALLAGGLFVLYRRSRKAEPPAEARSRGDG